MKSLIATAHLSDDEVKALGGKRLDDRAYDVLVTEDTEYYKPDGSPLLVYRRDCLPRNLCRIGYDIFSKVKVGTFNRGMAAGELDIDDDEIDGLKVGTRTRTRFNPQTRDGRISNTTYAQPARSGVVGFLDRNPREPYCRMTAFNLDHPDRFCLARPFIRAVDRVFRETLPDRYAAQAEAIRRTSPDFIIRDTAFTTITVNHNFQTAVHRDTRDLRAGFGVMCVLEGGRFDGGYLVFPKYRIAVDMRTGGVLLADVHEWHGNTPIIGRPGTFKRVSLVFYMRERMTECGTVREEDERARQRAT